MPDRTWTQAIAAELARAGITEHTVEHGGKHPRVVYHHQGRRCMYVLPGSPSDNVRGLRNALADIRRHLGLTAPARGKSTRPPKRRIPRDDAPAPVSFTVRPDPFAVLAGWQPAPVPVVPRWRWRRVTNRVWMMERADA